MLLILKNHLFAVEAFFESSLVLTFAVPKQELKGLIPDCLELDTLNDTYGFIAVAMVETKKLRPKGFPSFAGNDFFLIGYRIFVKYTTSEGKRLRGLYILKSETNKVKMEFLGNVFTHYNYTTTDIDLKRNGHVLSIKSTKSDLDIIVNTKAQDISLPEGSPFNDWKQARRYAGPLPFTFTCKPETKEVLIIEGVRENWIPRPVGILESHVGFINASRFKGAVLASSFLIEQIPYYWKKGKMDLWRG